MTTNNQPPKRGQWARLGELGPGWISAIAALIVALGTAGFFAGRVTTPNAAATPQTTTETTVVTTSTSVPTTSSTLSGPTSSPDLPTDVSGQPDGTQLASYNVTLTMGYGFNVKLTPPTQADITKAANQDIFNYGGGISSQHRMALLSTNKPTYAACKDSQLFSGRAILSPGLTFCILTPGRMVGVEVTDAKASPTNFIAMNITIWQGS